ncbi:MAG: putative Ig domain-containing protein [Kiritimatiellae bacterium]|nr:putative Ig domain-containing protein [Kiritimatiellia bacterium]
MRQCKCRRNFLYISLYVDDVLQTYWYTDGLSRDYYVNVIGYSLGTLSVGTHTIRMVTDATGVVAESNESNNSFETTITVVRNWFPNLSVSSLSASRTSIAISDSVTVHWWVANNDNGAADKNKIAFLTYKYEASSGEAKLVKTEWIDCLPLAAGGRQEFTKTINGKSLGEGVFSFAVAVDGDGTIVERSEADNVGFVAVSVSKDAATSSKSSVDWQFKKKDKEADAFFLSASPDLKKKATTFNVGQTIYMRCCWWNAKKNSVYSKMRCSIYLNGIRTLYGDVNSFEKNEYRFFTDTSPDFLQNLPAGNYTITAVLDSENEWLETDEKNNVKTISFTVVGTPKIFCETSYTCALNEPVSWPVTIDGKATVKGLPSGLKYSGGAITGKATKTGTYTVNISTKNEAGTATKSITIHVEDPGFTVSCSARPNGSSADSNVASGGTVEMFVGVNQAITLSSVPGKAGVANSDASVTAKGLPSGLKLSGGTITGVPTKAGTFAVTVAFKNKLSWTASFMLNIVVRPLPEWAQGTFTGVDIDYAIQEYGSATLSVASAGKVSGKVALCGTNWTFTAASYDSAVLYESGEPAEFRIKADMKAGKAVIPVELAVFAINPPETDGTPLQNARVYGKLAEDAELILWRTLWKDKTTAAEAKRVLGGYEGVYTMSLDADDVGSGYLSLTVGKDGNVKASGKLADGTSVSTTSPLMYDDAANGYFVYLYAAPSAYKGGSFALPAGIVSDGTAVAGRPPYRLVPVAFTPLWTSHNPEATGEYGAGFVRGLGFTGAYYDKLGTLKKYYESLRVSLDGGAPSLAYTYKETVLGENGKKATNSSVQTAEVINTFSQSGMTVSVNEKGALVVEKATKPVQDKESKEWYYEGTNDGALTLSFTQATGIFKGSYTFWYDYASAYDDTTGKETLAHTSKKATFEGIFVQGEEPKMEGFYLWDATGEYEDEKTGKLKSYKYKQSFPVRLLAQ